MIPWYWSKKNASRLLHGKFTVPGLKKKYDPMTPIEHFLIDITQILFRDWIENKIADIDRCIASTDIFQLTLFNFFYKRWLIIFFYGRGCFFVRCCPKNLQCWSARSFRSSSTEVVFRPSPACFRLLGMEDINQTRQKNMTPRCWSKKNASRRLPGKFTDPGLKKKYHPMTPIEHFLINITQILFSDWIENAIADIDRCIATTDIFQPTLFNFFFKRWPIIFFYGRGCFFVRCCRKNLQCTAARFFRWSSTNVVVRPTPACFHLLGMETINQPRKKNMFHRYWSKNILADVSLERSPIEV